MTILLVILLMLAALVSLGMFLIEYFRLHAFNETLLGVFVLAVGFLLVANVQLRSVDAMIDSLVGEEQTVT